MSPTESRHLAFLLGGTHPRAVRAPACIDGSGRSWAVAGTAYGYLHRTDGSIRTWRTYSGAYRAARRYVAL
jgi:hypothetical protein